MQEKGSGGYLSLFVLFLTQIQLNGVIDMVIYIHTYMMLVRYVGMEDTPSGGRLLRANFKYTF